MYKRQGVQIETLARSTLCRIQGLKPGDAGWPENAYNGDYIGDIAALDASIAVTDLRTEQPTLEQVFMALVGHRKGAAA